MKAFCKPWDIQTYEMFASHVSRRNTHFMEFMLLPLRVRVLSDDALGCTHDCWEPFRAFSVGFMY